MSVTVIRPNALVIQTFTPTVVGAGSALAAVIDNLDTSYYQLNSTYHYIRFAMGTFTVGANNRIRSCTIRARTARDGAGGTGQSTVYRMYTSKVHLGGESPAGSLSVVRNLTSILTNAGPIAYRGPGGVPWTQAVLDDLQLQAQTLKTTGVTQTPTQRIYELYVDVDVNSQPVVSAVTPTNFINNATPNIAWTYTDADNDIQTNYQVRVFDSATYSAANFNPDTSVPVWSISAAAADTNVDVAKALLNGVTYKAYVRAAQYWPGPNDPKAPAGLVSSNRWWSNWVASSTFTIQFAVPPAPTINSVTVLEDGNQYRTLVNCTVPINLLSLDDSSFESTIGDWAALTNCTVVRDTAQFADGAASMKMTSSAAGDMIAIANLDSSPGPRVDGGDQYTAVAQFRSAVSARSCQVGIEWLDISQVAIGSTVYGSSVTDSTANFNAQAFVTANAPTNAFYAKLHVKVLATGAAAEVHWVDKIQIIIGSSTTWVPGGYVNDQGGLVIERGEYLIDDRGPAENWFHPQVGSAGSVLQNAGYGFFVDSTQGTLEWAWLDKVIEASGNAATPPGKLDWHTGTATTPSIAFGAWFYGGTAYMVPVVASQSHTFSFWAWVDTGTATIIPRIDWRDKDGNVISSSTGSTVTLTTTPQQVTVTATAPGNALLACGAAQNNGSVSKHFYFTRLGFGLGTVPVDGKVAMGQSTGISTLGLPLGLDWKEIRSTSAPQLVLAPGYSTAQTQVFPDYEFPPKRPVIYRASIVYSFQAQAIRSAYSNQVVVYDDGPPVSLMRSLGDPTVQYAVTRKTDATFSITDDATVLHPLGADGEPVRIRDWVGGEDGQLVVYTRVSDGYSRLRQFIALGTTMVIQWSMGGRSYCVLTGFDADETVSKDKSIKAVTMSYIETGTP
jgi:hypothetical protein